MSAREIIASYEVSSMQQGMLLQSLHESGAYIQQLVCDLHEDLNESHLIRAWQEVAKRHNILRTAFRWEGVPEPLQEVYAKIELPWRSEDWSHFSPEQQRHQFAEFLLSDRKSSFDVTKPPLLRCACFKLSDMHHRLVWTFHHALLDGRSHFMILQETPGQIHTDATRRTALMDNVSDKKSRLSSAKRALLEQRLRGVSDSSQANRSIPRRPQQESAPLSFAQQRLWFLDQLQPGNSSYNVSRHLRIKGSFDRHALERALDALVERHESLRTVFRVQVNEPVQIIQSAQALPLPFIDLSELGENEREKETARLAGAHADTAFNLVSGPLLATQLIRLAPEDHILFLAVHHIVTDAWSTTLLIRELVTLYEAFRANEPSPLVDLPIQYADFAVWQRQFLQGETLERQLAYWKRQLTGAPAMLELPLDRPRPSVQTFRGDFETFALAADLSGALKDLALQEGATLFMALLAAFQTLLWRHTRQDEIVIGAPIANRTRTETESLVGFFVNTLVMRASIGASMTFRELLRQVKETTLEAYSHQDLPFEKLVEEIQPERSLSHNPLFQVTLSLQNVPQAFGLGNFTVDPMGFDSNTTRLDLEAYFWELPEGLMGEFVYSTDLFDRRTIQRLFQRFQILVAGLTRNPDTRVSELPLLTPDEREQLVVGKSVTKTEIALPESHGKDAGATTHGRDARATSDGRDARAASDCIHKFFERQVEQSPQSLAVCYEEEQLSYDELNRRANRLAHHLIKHGAGPEKLIGLCVERSIDLVVSVLGILKSGAAYVPLDPAYPPDRLSLISRDAELTLVLTRQSLAAAFSDSTTAAICLDEQADEIAAAGDQNPELSLDSESIAYVIYTSGSTGTPKGVAVTHRNVARLMTVTAPLFHFSAADVWTLFHSCSFDFSVWEIWGALCYGGRLVIVPYLVSRSPEDFYELLSREKVTILNQTPSAFRQLIQAESNVEKSDQRARLSPLSLREVIFGGEALELRTLKPWVDRHGDVRPRLVNMYGITETTVHVTYRPLTTAEVENDFASLIGRPLSDLQVYILDRQQQLAPIGVAGEMYVGGAGVARGYLRRPELTAERFVPDPFSDRPGARLYRTGDLARYLLPREVSRGEPGCEIEYLGRVDRQVKVRGFRIELGEIESVLAEHETVGECRVIPARDNADQQLLAYVIAAPDQTTSTETLRAFLKSRLPQYMVPASFISLDSWPLTPNGKIDERTLPPPDPSRSDLEGAFVAPRTDTEALLANLWSDVLRVEMIGINDNFFDLGGHSLLATQVMSRIRETFNVNMPLRYFFERPTVAGLAEFLRDARSEDQKVMPEIRRLPRG
jgi:amino acid adenylation domain-containing protein